MKKTYLIGAIVAAAVTASAAAASTLDDVKARGTLICGSNTGLVGFGAPDANGQWSGFDVDICQAVAAAVLGDKTKVKYVPTTGETRFTALASGEIDLLVRNSTWTFKRENDLKLTFVAVNYYDGQGFMVPKSLGVSSAKELDGATVCVQTGTTTELNLADYFKQNSMSYTPINVKTSAEGKQQFINGGCDVYTTDRSGLASLRATFAKPDDYVILPETISKEPLGPVVRQGDDQWASIVRWTTYALMEAEELGVTSQNIDTLAQGTKNPEMNRLLGVSDNLGGELGLDKDWAVRAIKANGNYGEIFAKNLSPIGLDRGLNAEWNKGGLIYAMPFH